MVTIQPGCAIAPSGVRLNLDAPVSLNVPAGSGPWRVVLTAREGDRPSLRVGDVPTLITLTTTVSLIPASGSPPQAISSDSLGIGEVARNSAGNLAVTPNAVLFAAAGHHRHTGEFLQDEFGNWHYDGPKLEGAAGPPGPQGPPGPIGPSGPSGPTGPQGATGPQGVSGPQGERGGAGPAGADGALGPAGAIGPAGAQGPQGVAGARGDRGDAGSIGPVGPAGPTGPQGAPGAQGLPGAAGERGIAGPAGGGRSPGTARTRGTAWIGRTARRDRDRRSSGGAGRRRSGWSGGASGCNGADGSRGTSRLDRRLGTGRANRARWSGRRDRRARPRWSCRPRHRPCAVHRIHQLEGRRAGDSAGGSIDVARAADPAVQPVARTGRANRAAGGAGVVRA